MIARLRPWVIVLTLASATSALAQQVPILPPSPPSATVNTQSAPIPDAVKAQASEHKQKATSDAGVQHNADQAPHNQAGGRDGSSSGNGKGSAHVDLPKPEEVTAEYTIYLVIATVALVFATIVLAVATIGLYRQTKRLAEQAVEASGDTKRSIEIAERSADASVRASHAAETSASVSEAALRADMRAWVSIDVVDLSVRGGATPDSKSDAFYFVSCVLRNSGKVPAVDLAVNSIMQPSNGDTAEEILRSRKFADECAGERRFFTKAVFPGSQTDAISNGILTRQEIDKFLQHGHGYEGVVLHVCATYINADTGALSQTFRIYYVSKNDNGGASKIELSDHGWMNVPICIVPASYVAT